MQRKQEYFVYLAASLLLIFGAFRVWQQATTEFAWYPFLFGITQCVIGTYLCTRKPLARWLGIAAGGNMFIIAATTIVALKIAQMKIDSLAPGAISESLWSISFLDWMSGVAGIAIVAILLATEQTFTEVHSEPVETASVQ